MLRAQIAGSIVPLHPRDGHQDTPSIDANAIPPFTKAMELRRGLFAMGHGPEEHSLSQAITAPCAARS